MSYIVTDETMMERALKSLRKIRRERKMEKETLSEPQEDSREQVMDSLREAFQELKLIKEGKEVGRPIEELFNEL